ncbi:dienelactone hydrolase family protein [Nocardia arthritidis]|uniref:Dienelactone hydrolase family protein n=1 Tax=Nocardia arthritidis TaxID=228602 RepID=A0A6G9YGV0_9NOCA|nr:dienelactone hydrolase family protein [Nocardia arthritidis]QIS12193.1 dienelactone hydrolase family protein [Nocardia arthritidis]
MYNYPLGMIVVNDVLPQNSATQMPTVTVSTCSLPYRDDDTSLAGVLYWSSTPAPGVLLVHGGAGLDQHARDQAHRYAELGYTVLACDMYGDGVRGDREKILECLTTLRDDPALLVRRATAGLTALSECPEATGDAVAIGFCFGGMVCLALARSGANLAAAVSIHGSLATSAPARPGGVKARILVCHGARDPHVPLTDVTAFAEEMNRADADWQLIMYGRAVHGFTHAQAVSGATPGVAYDRSADLHSFAATKALLAETLPIGGGRSLPR